MLKYNAVVISTTGAPGTGKTYSRCARFLWDHWLPQEKGVHYSNFPVRKEAFATKYPEASERIQVIAKEVLDSWVRRESGPWEYFKDYDLQGAHIALDECHNYIPRHGQGCMKVAQQWQHWLGEIRHRGCSVEFLSQSPQKVHKVIEQHSAVRIQLVNSEDRRDPILGILLGDWYELRAAFTREYEACIWQLEERCINGKWVQSDFQKFTLEPRYFVLYDSYNTPQNGGIKAEGVQREYQKRGFVGLLMWFMRRNWWRIGSRLVVLAFCLWLFLGGGIAFAIHQWGKFARASQEANTGQAHAGLRSPAERRAAKEAEAASAAAAIKEAPPARPVVKATRELMAGAKRPEVVEPPASPGGDLVRSETLAHRSLEKPPSAEAQQAAFPRLLVVGSEFVGLDDGQAVQVGEAVGEWNLVRIEYGRRRAIFCRGGIDEVVQTITVPVGGPVGLRLSPQKRTTEGIKDGISDLLPGSN